MEHRTPAIANAWLVAAAPPGRAGPRGTSASAVATPESTPGGCLSGKGAAVRCGSVEGGG